MQAKWRVKLSSKAEKQVLKLDKKPFDAIMSYLKQLEFIDNPRSTGKALQGNLKGLWRYRVGNYRIICNIQDKELTIYAVDIDHRKNIYRHKVGN
ncbi:type II toxin-antitoxin system RelE family toxin [Actinotignum urinale]|uniref:type II toxin-antitoxin system RelE family toxin n=1 Tax=Actinotignum urinale TaxID=190146 RepID=UPI0003B6E244|nr:type II toxin-antitoxin system RelE/ParE family toxin [Actinotignum urinale]MDY5160680.1 type II toxin-antitoxin system RelE/ParE family toxin [Actinotignum urinale]